MNADTHKLSAASTTIPRELGDPVTCREFAAEVITEWKRGEPVNAQAVLSRHTELRQFKSIVLDLLYEEYCLRIERGESVSISQFCERFPDYRQSIRQQLEIHQLISDIPELLPQWGVESWPQRGDALLGYTILDELGRGAFARAYLATEEALGRRQVVIKVSRHGEAEARMLGKLDHGNIVPVHSVQRDPQTELTVICMPFLGRATLNDVLDGLRFDSNRPRHARSILRAVAQLDSSAPAQLANLPPSLLRRGSFVDGVVYCGLQLANALASAHACGILHLDLKPSNVLVTPAGMPMLLDFNLSQDVLQSGTRVGGTLAYMSPEQLRAFIDPSAETVIDCRSDIFSLGVILFQLFSGQLPFGNAPEALGPKETAHELRLFRRICG